MTGRDLLFGDEINEAVREAYGAIGTGGGHEVADALYASDELALVPAGAVEWSLGVGNPVRHADLRPGEVVLDLGSGGGIDSILAARHVQPGGTVYGLDVLPAMVERAERHAAEARVEATTEFLQGEMEAIPLPDGSVDVVISNGVINLSPRKSRVLAEVRRVLRPGGRLCIADLTVEEELPPEIRASDAAWAG